MEMILGWSGKIWGAAVHSSSSEALILLLIGIGSVLIGAFWRKRTMSASGEVAEQES